MVTLGIEEEYLLLDPQSGLPANKAEQVAEHLHVSNRIHEDDIQRELLDCQIETATPVCHTLTEAEESLLNFRRQLHDAARKSGVRAASTGTAPRIEDAYPTLTDKPRYHQLKRSAPGVVGDQFVNGIHVHVAIPDQEAGVQALNRIREWLPVITAMSTNSPYWMDRDSGFCSWRVIHYRRWPVQGCTPLFKDAADYQRRIQRLIDTGVIIDSGVLTWIARLSDHYPTLEVRAGDAQLEAQDSVLLAGLIRGLVTTAVADAVADRPYRTPNDELLDAALWQAARNGIGNQLVDFQSEKLVPAQNQIDALIRHIRPALEDEGDLDWIHAGLKTLHERGTGADRQRTAMNDGGLPALIDLYGSTLGAERAANIT